MRLTSTVGQSAMVIFSRAISNRFLTNVIRLITFDFAVMAGQKSLLSNDVKATRKEIDNVADRAG